jgi:hypothetical protein
LSVRSRQGPFKDRKAVFFGTGVAIGLSILSISKGAGMVIWGVRKDWEVGSRKSQIDCIFV